MRPRQNSVRDSIELDIIKLACVLLEVTALTIDSTDDRPWYYRSKLKYYKKEFDNSLKDINQAIELNNKDADYYIARAKIYMFNDNEYDDDLGEDDLYTALKMGSDEAKSLLEEFYQDDDGGLY